MGGDHAPGPILEGCLDAIDRLPLKIRFVGEIERVMAAANNLGLRESLESARAAGHLDLVASGPSIGMDDEATAVRRKRDASINMAMDLVKKGEALAVYSAGNSGAVMASAIFRLGRLKGIDRPGITGGVHRLGLAFLHEVHGHIDAGVSFAPHRRGFVIHADGGPTGHQVQMSCCPRTLQGFA